MAVVLGINEVKGMGVMICKPGSYQCGGCPGKKIIAMRGDLGRKYVGQVKKKTTEIMREPGFDQNGDCVLEQV